MGEPPRRRQRSGGWIGLSIALALMVALSYAASHLRVTSSLTHFVTSEEEAVLGTIAARMADSEGARTMIFTVEGATLAESLAAAEALATAVRNHPEVAWVRTGVNPSVAESFYELFYPHRFAFASDEPEQALPPRLSDSGLEQMAIELKRRLGLPTGALVKRIAPGDPWLFFLDRVSALERMRQGSLRVHEDRLITADGTAAVVLLATGHSPFDARYQGDLHDTVEATISTITASGKHLVIERSAVHRLAVRSERQIRTDVQRVSILSTIAVILLFGALYRSLRVLLLALLPLAVGFVTAAAACAALFHQVHGITLAFGAALIGVAIDYPVHLFTHHALAPASDDPVATLRKIAPELRLGALTTVTVFSGLALAGLPGVRELGVFAAVGVSVALATTFFVVPALAPLQLADTRLQRGLARGMRAALAWAATHRRIILLVPGAAILLCALGLPSLTWVDDAAALNRLEPTALAEDERVRRRVSRMDLGRLVVATGGTLEQALERNDALAVRLRTAEREGKVEFVSLHDLLWSEALQSRNRAVFERTSGLTERLLQALEAQGFRPEAFAPVSRDLAALPEPLRTERVLESPLASIARPFLMQGQGDPAVVTFVRELETPNVLASFLDDLPGVYDFDQRRFSAGLYRRYRERVMTVVGLGLAAVLGVLLVRYRRVGSAVAAIAPALLAVASTCSVLAVLGESLHIFHLIGLLLVLGMGADYGIFMVERSLHERELGPTLVSVTVACATTVCGFGLLAWSSNPALHALGFTVGVGVLLSLVFAPTTLLLVKVRKPS